MRENGAVPATIGIVRGVPHVGLDRDTLRELLESSAPRKISRRDLAFAAGSVSDSNMLCRTITRKASANVHAD